MDLPALPTELVGLPFAAQSITVVDGSQGFKMADDEDEDPIVDEV